MHDDTPPQDHVILSAIGNGIDPNKLIDDLKVEYDFANIIEALQRAIERGKITLDANGMVVATQVMAEAA
ncbi:MAG: hypothetical protein B7Y36_06340 [Novosphingobium sp. 28-62-57]|uniref:hypothetical protein n=1 Tax=unclassified Novosphingobium TaxID=2644732 RepID=UPI000BDA2A11|nr:MULTISPECIES: hypothetical protein [unclassified Novosphingobium]OYW50148.1 MAG: hypothetical protein B7Z34_04575 [Novosphingobium sp. 12-62-10]OYZ11747.1 MAG: hypothetical protein B7Y36_06340 [Novosphingobium sp. 28-62-57]OZA33765.1 MAG: hypothetical protein B7X92_11135 [Novosphingobium sp. 17-62-9]